MTKEYITQKTHAHLHVRSLHTLFLHLTNKINYRLTVTLYRKIEVIVELNQKSCTNSHTISQY